MNNDQPLVPVFMPALAPLLIEAEELKGSPLTEAEALRIRDEAQSVVTPRDVARAVAKSRGYEDLDPENCWADWQVLRRELGSAKRGRCPPIRRVGIAHRNCKRSLHRPFAGRNAA